MSHRTKCKSNCAHTGCNVRLCGWKVRINVSVAAEKIELFIGEYLQQNGDSEVTPGKVDLDKIHFILLGHVSMSTNLSTSFKARELKSISVECVGTFMKLLVHKNYLNKYNRRNQVS